MNMPKGVKGFQKGHTVNVGRVKSIPVYCACGKQLAKTPSKRGERGLCQRCACSRPFSEEHKKKISKALKGQEKKAEHCKKLSDAAKARYKNPEDHPRWRGGNRSYHLKKAREIMGVTDKNLHVHHKDGNWRNNDPSNLLVLTKEEHSTLHNLLGRASKANQKAQLYFKIKRAMEELFK